MRVLTLFCVSGPCSHHLLTNIELCHMTSSPLDVNLLLSVLLSPSLSLSIIRCLLDLFLWLNFTDYFPVVQEVEQQQQTRTMNTHTGLNIWQRTQWKSCLLWSRSCGWCGAAVKSFRWMGAPLTGQWWAWLTQTAAVCCCFLFINQIHICPAMMLETQMCNNVFWSTGWCLCGILKISYTNDLLNYFQHLLHRAKCGPQPDQSQIPFCPLWIQDSVNVWMTCVTNVNIL